MDSSTSAKGDLRVVIITVSDSRHSGSKEDTSGKLLVKLALDAWNIPVVTKIVSDEIDEIQSAIKSFSDGEQPTADLIITTGGTGFAERDVTPEATRPLLTKEAPGLITALLVRGLEATPLAALSRLVAGVRGRTLIVNFPGSVKAVKECWEVLEPLVPHAVDLLRGRSQSAEVVHRNLAHQQQSESDHHQHRSHEGGGGGHHHHHHEHHHHHGDGAKSSVDTGNVAGRPRESPYPMIAFDDALKIVLNEAATFPRRIVNVDLMEALNRILAEDVRAEDPQPPFPASIKDGYAVIAADGDGERKVVNTAATAGVWCLPTLSPGTCMRISTGAPVPLGADAVVQVEDTKLIEQKDGEELTIFINKTPTIGQDIRHVGSDVAADEIVLTKGAMITSAEIGLLASVGKTRVAVYEHPMVAVMSTGDELVDPLKSKSIRSLSYGKIRDSNRPELMALLVQEGVDTARVLDAGICPDEPDALLSLLKKVFDQADILVTSGGVSMGERDLLKQILIKDLGFQLHFAGVQMKPGKPTTFATGRWRNGTETKPVFVFGLPGNPVSAWVTAQLYVLPTVRQIIGIDHPKATVIKVKVIEDFHLDSRPEFVRAVFKPPPPMDSSDGGIPSAELTDRNQMSCRLLSNRRANLLLLLPPRTEHKSIVRAGEIVSAMVIGRI